MAQVVENPDGTFSSVVEDTDVTGMDYDDMVDSGIIDEVTEEVQPDDLETEEDILDGVLSDPLEDPEEVPVDSDDLSDPVVIMPYSSVDSDAVFSPVDWQLNLARSRSLGEHYLMYAQRIQNGSYNRYWHYYLILGSDISYANDIYTYDNCDIYSYYADGSAAAYEVTAGSGSVDGDQYLVYSDLYFDYVGTDPMWNTFPYVVYMMLLIIFVMILIGGRRRV